MAPFPISPAPLRAGAILLAAVLAAVGVGMAGCGRRDPPPPTVAAVDWDRYLGTWYELARFDHRFERGLAAVTATYAKRSDGRISVLNRGRRGGVDGEVSAASGSAAIAGPAELSVRFFWPFAGAYRVLALADDYRWAVVGSSGRGYLWFLHRQPQAPAEDWAAMEAAARAAGYDLAGLIKVAQPAR